MLGAPDIKHHVRTRIDQPINFVHLDLVDFVIPVCYTLRFSSRSTHMPYKDPEVRRLYFRDLMRRRRAGESAAPKPQAKAAGDDAALKAKVVELEKALAKATAGLQETADKVRRDDNDNIHRANLAAAKKLRAEIRRFRLENRKLREEVQYLKLSLAARPSAAHAMPRKLEIALDKALHPDRRKHRTEAERDADQDDAYKQLNAWKDDNKKVQRSSR